MDRRRKRVAGLPGTLWLGKNVHISRGGDIERAKKFVSTHSLPANTFGLGQVRGQLFVFGSVVDPGVPIGVQYQRLQSDGGSAMVEVLDVDTFDGSFYVIARFAEGDIHHFYNGTRITDWDTIADTATDFNVLADYLAELVDADADVSAVATGQVVTVTARVPGTAFTITKSTTDNGGTSDQDITLATVQANVAAVAETRATSVCEIIAGTAGTIEDITVDSVSLMWAPVTWAASHTATAAAVAVQINNKTVTHGYTAEASGAEITLTAATGIGATPNGDAVASSVTGDVVLSTPSVSGGVTTVTAVAQIVTATLSGTLEAEDVYMLTINGTDYVTTARAAATGISAFVHKKRMWSPANTLWNYSKLNDATNWTDTGAASGAGFLRLSRESEGSERLVGAAPYGTQAAVFSRNAVHIWNIDTDAELNEIGQPLGNTGSLAARAILPFGNLDVFYLDEPGIRSLRSKDQTGEAYSSDIGNPIDPFVRDHLNTLTEAKIRRAVSVIGPEGRFWMAVGGYIFVLSYFPGSKIMAWSYYDADLEFSDFVRVRNKVYARAGDVIYLYGGVTGNTFPDDDEMISEVETAFITAQTPATIKQLTGFDIACTGQWETSVLVNPNDETQMVDIGILSETTYNIPNGRIGIPAVTSHMALRMVCSKAGEATISSIALHYEPAEAS